MPGFSSSTRSAKGPKRDRGFSLIELLAVLAIIGILLGVLIGGGRRASEASNVAQAKAEVAALAAALETYRRQHGDFPRATSPTEWVHALVSGPSGRVLLDLNRFSFEGGADPLLETGARLLDPWGHPYFYFYQTGGPAAWKASGFVLYSAGPNGVHVPPNEGSGFFDPLHLDNADNIYAAQ